MINVSKLRFDVNKIACFKNYSIIFQKVTDSTNEDLKNVCEKSLPLILIAEEQKAGRGQYGRKWESPPKNGIYLSFSWTPNKQNTKCSIPISIVTGLALYNSICLNAENNIENIWIKWPNDIYYLNRKLAGILIDVKATGNTTNFIIGIGINLKPIQTQSFSSSGLSEISPNITASEFLSSFFKQWHNTISLSEEEKIVKWTCAAHKFMQTPLAYLNNEGKQIIVKATKLNPDGTIEVQTSNSDTFVVSSSKNLQLLLDTERKLV